MTDDAGFTGWLLESTIPTIRYRTLVDLLGRPADDPAVVAAQEAILSEGPVPALYARQDPAGHWQKAEHFYSPKYRSTHWTMLLLDELDAPGDDPRFRRGADYMLSSVAERMNRRSASDEYGWSCLFANVLHYAARAGLVDDPRTAAIIDYVTIDLGRRCACAYNYGFACSWGAARSLWGAAAVPPDARMPALQAAIDTGVGFLLDEFSLAAADYPVGDGKIHPMWHRLNFPLFYQADILFALRALADADALDHPGAEPALAWLAEKRGANGRWRGSSPYRAKTWAAIGDREETDRWVSLHSATLLMQWA